MIRYGLISFAGCMVLLVSGCSRSGGTEPIGVVLRADPDDDVGHAIAFFDSMTGEELPDLNSQLAPRLLEKIKAGGK